MELIDRKALMDYLTKEWDGDVLHLFQFIARQPTGATKITMTEKGITFEYEVDGHTEVKTWVTQKI